MSYNTIKNEYNQLDNESKQLFKAFHAPARLKQNEALVRRYNPFYMEHNKTFRLPKGNELLLESAEGIKTRMCYIVIPVKAANELTAISRYQDDRGLYVDELGKVHKDILFQSGKYFKLVSDLDQELEFVRGLVSKPTISPSARMTAKEVETAIVEESKETIEVGKIKQLYSENKQKYSKKEFLAYLKDEHQIEITKYRLDKILKANEAV